MKYKDIQLLSDQACEDKLQAERDYLTKLRFAHAISLIENPMKIRQSRKLLARLKTAQRMRQLKQPLI